VLGEIEGFSMRSLRGAGNTLVADQARFSAVRHERASAGDVSARGIAPAEGARAFMRILAADAPPGVFVLPNGLGTRPQRLKAPRESAVSQSAASTQDVETMLAEWWQELLGVEQVRLDDDFFELGGQSLIVVRLFSKIKKTYGVNFGLSTLFEARTVRTLGRLIREALAKTQPERPQSRASVAIQPNGMRLPLFVISGLGGNVIKYHSLARHLGDDQPVYGLLPRGLDGNEPYHTRVEDMAAYYVSAIRLVQRSGPYRLAGYSFGGAVAFETAQQLVAAGESVSLLGLFDTIEFQYWEQVKRSYGLSKRLAHYRSMFHEAVADRDFAPFWNRVKAKSGLLKSKLLHPRTSPPAPAMDKIEEVNMAAAASYRPKPYAGRLTLFRSTMRTPDCGDDEFLGWGHLAPGGIDLCHVPSMHSNILDEPGVESLSEKLRECLDRDPAPTAGWRALRLQPSVG
jgi:thioesterase domain-containing protein/acyl carrier protein